MKKILLSVFILSLLTTGSAFASEGESYAGLQYGSGTYSEDGFDDANPNILVGRYGKFINDNSAIEGRIGFSLGEDSIRDPLVGELTIEVDSLIGVYWLGHIPINDTSSFYGVLGLSRGEFTAAAPEFSSATFTEDDTGLSFGVGSNVGISDSLALNIEYIQYLSASDYDYSAIGLGLVFALK